jgi:hemin uptake protein HemP
MQKEPPPTNKPASYKVVQTSENLFQGKKELLIEHRNELYQLRITRNGKLILTK